MMTFTDFDQFADAIGGVRGRFIPTGASRAEWWLDARRLGQLRLQRLQIGAPAAYAGDGEDGYMTIAIPTSAAPGISINGLVMAENSFILNRHAHPLTYSARTPTSWLVLTMPTAGGAYSHELARVASGKPWRVRFEADDAALRRVSLLVRCLASDEEAISVADPNAAAVAEEDLLAAAAELLRKSTCATSSPIGRPRISRERLIARCLEFLRENASKPVLVTDMCNAAQISERTLRNIFIEYFGVGPARFLKAHQLHEIRRRLLAAEGPCETITSIATHLGVWDFSLFARNYRAMYGESPSETLRSATAYRAPQRRVREADSRRSWMAYASRCFRADRYGANLILP
ncbi:MAG TPA: helix-turn-helix domain-containing protein [Povalibacter sp.]|nr:helix-turn-helix domain-containing protein [Povalibacter sp.]